MTLAAGVGVVEGLEEYGLRPRLKWPNDVMLGDRKVGGILSESSFTGPSLEWIVLGIGTNVRGPVSSDLRTTAVSLVEAGAATAEAPDVAVAVLARVAVWYHRLVDDGRAPMLNAWRERSLPWWGERIGALSAEGRIEGRAIGLDDEGGFVLELDDGSRRTLRSGEVWRARAV